jgi:hypothetical protein
MGRFLFLVALTCLLPAVAPAEPPPYRVAAGVNLGGGQVDWRLSRKWMIEARAQTSRNDEESIDATVVGGRVYRYLHQGRPSVFAGVEVADATARQSSTPYRAHGFVGGLFGGLEFRLIPHVYLLADAGPYVISLKESRTGVSEGTLDFVVDAALVVGF